MHSITAFLIKYKLEMEKPKVYDSDLDDKSDDGEKKPETENKDEKEKKKVTRKPQIKLDPEFLVDGPRGLRRLYKHMVVDADKNLQLKGKGHEVSDLNRVMKVMRGWHFEAMPKLEISYFAERLQKVGNDKATKAFMSRLRNVYKGLEVLEDFQNSNNNEQQIALNGAQQASTNNGGFEYINTSTNNHNPFDDYQNFLSTKPITAQAAGVKKGDSQPFFKLIEPPQGQT